MAGSTGTVNGATFAPFGLDLANPLVDVTILLVVEVVVVCAGYSFWLYASLSLREAERGIGQRRIGVYDGSVRGLGPVEPAHRAYWSEQMWRDAERVAVGALRAIWDRLTKRSLGRTARRLLQGRRPDTGQRGENWFTTAVMGASAPGIALGATLGAMLAALAMAVALSGFVLLCCLVWLLAAAAVAALRGVEAAGALARGVRMKCPYPGCYRPIPLAVHRCPSCDVPHGELRPGRFGALWHVCTCGRRLPTLTLAGRGRFATRCPHCDQELPEELGRVRVVHVPLIGGTSSGKTMLMTAMVAGLESFSRRSPLRVGYASRADEQDAAKLRQQVQQAGWAHKTQGGQPRAFMLTVRRGRQQRLLYLYDPMGESLRTADAVREQQYLAHAQTVILVADVLADPGLRRALQGEDARRADGARPADQGPLDTYQRLTGELTALTGRRGRLPVAVVVTKRDVLDQMASLPVLGARIDGWLTDVGLGALVRALKHDFGRARYWAVSAHAATGTGAPQESEQRRAAEPVLWALSHSGLRTGTLVTEPPPGAPGARGGAARAFRGR